MEAALVGGLTLDFTRRFTVLMCTPSFDPDDLEGRRIEQIVQAVETSGFEVIRARKVEDAAIAVQTDAAIGCMVVDWGKRGLEGKTAALVNLMRRRGLEMPIVVMVRRKRLEDIPVEVVDFIDGYIFLAEETPEYIARGLVSRVKQYAETLKTPFFGALVDYAEQGNQLWTCPGHNGGVFYNRSPIGRIFVEHLGEAIFRDDIDNSVLELGDLLVHEGPALRAQREAAQIFGAERTYFVLNGTSASNKVVLNALVAEDDLVLFDRNNHKAALHGALVLGGAIPIFLPTDRNAYGLIGPIQHAALDEAAIRERIRVNPLVTDPDAWRRERPFRVAVIEQCTYDGTIYSAEEIVRRIGHLCDYVLFDEAWAGFMKFHPLYAGRFAMGLKDLDAASPGIVATQSAHKQLASFSQASQIHTKDAHIRGQERRVEHRRMNESFLLHASTSPFYPIFASLDVGAQMMKGRSGQVLWDDTVRLGIELRKKLRAIRREFEERDGDPHARWFFDPFVPDRVEVPASEDEPAHEARWEMVPTDDLASDPRYWALDPENPWHGFKTVARGFAMTDPCKLTILTPGFDRASGGLCRDWRPGADRRAIPAGEPGRAREERPQLPALPADAGRRIVEGRHADLGARRLQAPSRRECAPRGGHAGFRAAAIPTLRRPQAAGSLPRVPRLPPRARHEPAAARAVLARPPAGHGGGAARGLSRACPQQGRLRSDRGGRGTHRDDLDARLPARHRHDRAGRADRRAGEADARLLQDVREELESVPRPRRRDPGGLPRDAARRTRPLLHLRDARRHRCRTRHQLARGLMDPASLVDGALVIRPSTDTDVTAMVAIYAYHIGRGIGDLGAYEAEEIDAEDLKRRRRNMRRKRLPHLVADLDGEVAAYAYAVPFRKRPAYRYTVKHSIYVHPARVGLGIGRRLLPALIDACAEGGFRQMIGYIDGANAASLKLHDACGFRRVGVLPAVAFKFGHWSDSIMVQRALGDGDASAPGTWTAACG